MTNFAQTVRRSPEYDKPKFLLPHIDDLRKVTVAVAGAVAAESLAAVELANIVQPAEDAISKPEYRRIEASR